MRPTRELLAFAAVVLPFALAMLLAGWQVLGLARLGRRREALVALVLPPAGAVLSWRAGLRGRALGLALSLVAYGLARWLLG